jgi:hypothetical protein
MKICTIILAMLFCFKAQATANKSMPEELTIASENYYLCKEHTIKYAYVIKIAYVGLYLKDCQIDHVNVQLEDKLIRFNYQVNVKAKVFIDSAEEFYLKNLQAINKKELEELYRFNQLYENIQASEYYDVHHKQGQSLILYKNSELLGSSNNEKFSSNYFNIWFGKYPAVKPLKKSFINALKVNNT